MIYGVVVNAASKQIACLGSRGFESLSSTFFLLPYFSFPTRPAVPHSV